MNFQLFFSFKLNPTGHLGLLVAITSLKSIDTRFGRIEMRFSSWSHHSLMGIPTLIHTLIDVTLSASSLFLLGLDKNFIILLFAFYLI